MKEPLITEELIREHGLTPDEYGRVVSILGRSPTFTELGIFSVMWSEHCSYKSSRLHLKKLPTEAPWVIQGPGENAGVIDIGDGLAAVFKMESHNHPSFIEPYEGAATGVGGILRDIFTMGARPVASLNSLRFGPLSDPYHKHLFGGVVSGIAGYGNCIGVPTVGGEIYCHPCYAGNILVNVFNVGIVKKDKIFYGAATGTGNLIIYAGSKTGKDGIHGVTMASEEFTDDAQQKKPNVQIGDPFTEKLLLEACLEAMDKGLIVGIQDMGGAGLTSSSSEMAGRAATGIELELSSVPLRAEGMIPYEIMLSESQERMLLVVAQENKDTLIDIFKKWDLDAVVIGKVGGDGFLRVNWHGKMAAEIPATKISTDAPIYDRPSKRPSNQDELNTLDLSGIPDVGNAHGALKKLLASPAIASKELVWQQYDHMVRTDTIVKPGSDAAVVRIKGTKKALAMSVDCNSRYCWLDPYIGAIAAVCEAARNVACSGATPLAVTDNLNFGNPEKPEVMWQFIRAVEGIRDACVALNTPVISGNVSLHNETKGDAIYPTPTIAVVGVLDDADRALTQWFKGAGDVVMLIGQTNEELGGSEYLYVCHALERGLPPAIDPAKEHALHKVLVALNGRGLLRCAHDCSEGGLAVAVAESTFGGLIGAEIDLGQSSMRKDALLFGESATRVVISVATGNVAEVEAAVRAVGLSIAQIGRTGGDILRVKCNGETLIDMPVSDLKSIYDTSLERGLNQNEHI
ncbi:phosphoribosylformylglycinamidine synthase subunit PurL [Candidatus Magnetominusculus dajiuhuensis]|uniref:phosphoribosylformylglycinamidine synthase subunit PurL n=1 Tax=Candidatus Magnetominusculus dajiuhuensis TaxID=3137712 RepID=UPI003B42F072